MPSDSGPSCAAGGNGPSTPRGPAAGAALIGRLSIRGSGPGGAPAAPLAPPQLDSETQAEVRLAPRYRVLIHNDDQTPMDFVVGVLFEVFRIGIEESIRIMLEAHQKGVALVVVLSLEEAEFRIERAHAIARTAKYPLTFSMEPE